MTPPLDGDGTPVRPDRLHDSPAQEDGRVHVVVVGGGIAGLAAARTLSSEPGVQVTLLEATGSVGGKLKASSFAGHVVDEGAEQVLVRTPEAADLIRDLGLGDEVVHPRT